jgi:hypothetical protein
MTTDTANRPSVTIHTEYGIMSLAQFVVSKRRSVERIVTLYENLAWFWGHSFTSPSEIETWRYRLALAEEQIVVLDHFSEGRSQCEGDEDDFIGPDDFADDDFRKINGRERIDEQLDILFGAKEDASDLIQKTASAIDSELSVLSNIEIFTPFIKAQVSRTVADMDGYSGIDVDGDTLKFLFEYFGPGGEGSQWDLMEYVYNQVAKKIHRHTLP